MSNYINNFSINTVKSSKIAILVAALVIFAVIPTVVQAVAPAEQWNKTFGGTFDDSANSVQNTSDGGYIIAGTTSSYGAGGSDGSFVTIPFPFRYTRVFAVPRSIARSFDMNPNNASSMHLSP